ncbi:benzoate/H(+) symporter BenE family transporter [Nocardia asteroides NBRC 15531]|uniref:BenE family transporter n=1 Tax=Nocardia asteroides NBRC 15531 TaxID=1110697 RepID=U5ECH5_NOCAS|nr:benzoate/H(+) symporter BenE family transporter [Nocardia asteroides]TLF65741.1 benzoate/H(+) symporter BenE family transporter [Nocardia asteroides NBRC 15531]UGT47487.1 benzoate/H(+) symporter BenE family transporter [Nocardia asteroides]SFM46501.1 benzoate membrane transport protein [Nocardia asteroides]VEG33606.1 Inner membrane protein ydcO [Nocardia asteroides]GAD87847.1 putative BenE family transporter [Nocardia asteroides NBRC 15531]
MSQVTTTSPDEAAEARSGIGQPLGAGAITALVGFTSSFAVVLSGLRAVGASPAQAASGLMILCFTQGIGILLLSFRYRIPITLAWSTPGAALLASTGLVAGGWPGAVAAFGVTGVLIVITGLWQRLGSLVAAIPVPIAQAMLAGVLVPLCLAPVQALRTSPAVVVPVILVWLVLQRFAPKWAVLVAFATAAIGTGIYIAVGHRHLEPAAMVPTVELTVPQWHWQAIIGIAVPLYIVTMASQNIPGVAVMRSFDYQVPWRASMLVTGVGTIAGAAAGGHAINLAAISAALSAAPSASPDPKRRWIAAATAGGSYLILGLASAALVTLIAAAPAGTLETVAGLALLATLAAALTGALSDPEHRMAGLVTFLVAASGTTLFGIGGAFWALVAGLVVRRVLP